MLQQGLNIRSIRHSRNGYTPLLTKDLGQDKSTNLAMEKY